MKHLPITFLSLFLIFTSCSTSNDNLNVSLNDEQENKLQQSSFIEETKSEDVKNLMYMTSYLIARTLQEDEAAQQEFYKLGAEKALNIDLRTLLSSSGSSFEKAFQLRYKRYNTTKKQQGEPTPPVSQAIPDPLERGYNLLTISYTEYLGLIQNTYDWIVDLPNKDILYQFESFDDYFKKYDCILNLWSYDNSKYSDGLRISYDNGWFISAKFDYQTELQNTLILTLRNKYE